MTESEQGLRAIFLQNYGGCLTTQDLRVMSFVVAYCDRAVQAARRQAFTEALQVLRSHAGIDFAERDIQRLRDEEASNG